MIEASELAIETFPLRQIGGLWTVHVSSICLVDESEIRCGLEARY